MNFLEAIASPFKKAGSWIADRASDVKDWFSDRASDVGDWLSDVATSDSWDSFLNGSANKVNKEIAETNLDYQRQRNEIEDLRYADETAYNRSFAEENQAYNRAFAEENQTYNRSFAEENQAYNRAFAEDDRNYNRMFAEEERDYQRAFAKEQQEYDRALQQKIFEREDTAIQRQASALSELGINPIAQSLNGLGAGQVIQSVAPTMASTPSSFAPSSFAPSSFAPSSFAPNSSNRGGKALENKYMRQSAGLVSAIAPMLSIASMFQDFQTGNLQRDSLALQNDRLALDNSQKAMDMGLNYKSPTRKNNKRNGLFSYDGVSPAYPRGYESMEKSDKIREWEGKVNSGIFDFDSPFVKNVKSVGNMDFNKVLENALTNAAKLGKGLIDLVF